MGVLTRGDYRRRLILLAAALALAIAALVIVPNTSASGEEATSFGEPAGVLLLGVDSAAASVRVEYYPEADRDVGLRTPAPEGAQTFRIDKRCKVIPLPDDPEYLTISPGGGSHSSAVSNGLGVGLKNNCSTAQGRIDATQELTFSLGMYFAGSDVKVKTVEVDVEGKFSADLKYALDGGDYVVPSVNLPNTSDNGPDAGVGDNNAVSIAPSVFFTSVTFSADGGEVAIEGGGDGELAERGELQDAFDRNESVFELESVRVIECGTDEIEGGGDDPLATLTLVDEPGCEPIPIAFRTDLDSVFLDKPASASGTFDMTIEWDPEAPIYPVPPTLIDFNPNDESEGRPVNWCGTTTDPWCLVSQSTELNDGGLMVVMETYRGSGDPRWAR